MWSLAAIAVLLLFQPADFNAEGLKALNEEKYEEAAQAFQQAVEADPEDYGARFHLALAHSLLGDSAEAIAGYEKVLELKPRLYEAELNLGLLLLDQKDPRRAIPHLESAVEEKPKEFRPNYYFAEALYESGDLARAEQHYKAAAALDPQSAATQAGLARAISKQGRLEEAAVHYRRAAELDADYRTALLELASLFEEENRLPEAIDLYRQFQDDPAVGERLGQLLLETGRLEEAVPQLQAAVRESPTAANRYALATAYLRSRQLDKAAPLLELARQDSPDNFDLRMTYGRVLRDQRKYAAAAQEFLQAARGRPQSGEAWAELAGMLILIENYPQALAALDRVEALGHQTAAVHFFRAIMLDKARQYRPALERYRRYLAMSNGETPDEEFKARQRVKVIKKELSKR